MGLNISATCVVVGTFSLSSSSHLLPMEASKLVNPVALLPGRDKLSTKPRPTGSETCTNTMGMLRVILRRAATDWVEARRERPRRSRATYERDELATSDETWHLIPPAGRLRPDDSTVEPAPGGVLRGHRQSV